MPYWKFRNYGFSRVSNLYWVHRKGKKEYKPELIKRNVPLSKVKKLKTCEVGKVTLGKKSPGGTTSHID